MEESKEIQSIYSIFRVVIYVSLVIEFFEYACNPDLLDSFAGVLTDIHERMGRWTIYQPGHLAYSKVATLLLVIITCIGTRNKKQIEFDARKMVFWPISIGLILVIVSVWLYYTNILDYSLLWFPVSIWLYMAASIVGTVCIHVALDNVSKYLKEGLMKDRFNFENESFEQNLLEYPQYTRPIEWKGRKVPDVLMSGHHENIAKWQRQQALQITKKRRPDLFEKLLDLE
jgi:hypothetical protein